MVILSTLGFTTCCSFGEPANALATKPKNGTPAVKVKKLTVGSRAPLLAYTDVGAIYAVDFGSKVRDNCTSYPTIVAFVGKLSKAEHSRLSKVSLKLPGTLVRTFCYVISGDDVQIPTFGSSERVAGRPVKVINGQKVKVISDPLTRTEIESTVGGPGYTLSTWGIRSSDKLVVFLVDGDGTIVWRHDGLDAFDVNAFRSVAKRTSTIRGVTKVQYPTRSMRGITEELRTCDQCDGKMVTRQRCGTCNGLGSLRCDECFDGSYVSASGRRQQCGNCDGNANVGCPQCGVHKSLTYFPKGKGYQDLPCRTCDGAGAKWYPTKVNYVYP
jgi:hypothetical protein